MPKILLVEDDAALLAGLRYSMEKDGLEVSSAGCVKEGRERFQKEKVDLCILDVTLPDGTGFDLCKEIRKTSGVPILFLTACDEEVSVVMGLDMGGDDYITKPFRLRELLSRVHAQLRRSSGLRTGGVLRSQNLSLLTGECRLFRENEEVPLTPAEYRLLCKLMQNPRRTLTRTQLLDTLWDTGGDFVDANTLTVYIRRLREKIEDDPSSPKLIATVRGVGYRWEADTENGGLEVQHE